MLLCESFNGKVDGNEVVVPFVSTAFFSDIKLFPKFLSSKQGELHWDQNGARTRKLQVER